MALVEMTWLGGPEDGSTLLVQTTRSHESIKVLHGSKKHPETHYVTPRHLDDGRWVLPWTEAIINLRRPDEGD